MRRIVIIAIMLAFVMLVSSFAFAETNQAQADIDATDGGYYFETIIEDECDTPKDAIRNIMTRGTTTKTKSKTVNCKNSSGSVMWYVKVTGTFTYGNGSSKCTKSVCTAESKNKAWKVTNRSSSKSGNAASASAKGTHYLNGSPVETIKKTVTLKCSPTGNFS